MKIYIWEVIIRSPEVFEGLPELYRDHRRGSGGLPGGSTCPGGPYGLYVEGNQLLSGLGAIPLGPMRLGLGGGDPKGGAPLGLGGKPPPPLAAAPL